MRAQPDAAPARRSPLGARGIAIPALLFIVAVCATLVLLMAHLALQRQRVSQSTMVINSGSLTADAGIQLGLAELNFKVSTVTARMTEGLAARTPPRISEEDIADYDQTRPGLFWKEWINDIRGVGDPTNFQVDDSSRTAFFDLNTASHQVRVTLRYANGIYGYTAGTSYNDATLRYTYEIESVDKKTGKRTRVLSYTNRDSTIQIHLARVLSRYNLFADFNTSPDVPPIPVYDPSTYSGKVYSRNTFYVEGNPRYARGIEISKVAFDNPPFWRFRRQDSPGVYSYFNYNGFGGTPPAQAEFRFYKSGTTPVDAPNPTLGEYLDPPLSLPDSVDEDQQRRQSLRVGPLEPLPGAYAALGIYPTTAPVNFKSSGLTVDTTASVYVMGNATITIRSPGAGTTTFFDIRSEGTGWCPPPPTSLGPWPEPPNGTPEPLQCMTVRQFVWDWTDPNFLIFVDGDAFVRGRIGKDNRVTIAARDKLFITGSTEYYGGISATTVLGLVSWNNNVMVPHMPTPLPAGNVLVHAVIMTPNGGFGAENYAGDFAAYTEPNAVRGIVSHTGAIIRKYAIPFVNSDRTRGWGYNTTYDVFLETTKAPPFFPGNGRYEVRDQNLLRVVDLFFVQ